MKRFALLILLFCCCTPCVAQDDFWSPTPTQESRNDTIRPVDGHDPREGVLAGTRLTEIWNMLQQARDERRELNTLVEGLLFERDGLLAAIRDLRDQAEANKELATKLGDGLREWRDSIELERNERRQAWQEWRDNIKLEREERAQGWKDWREAMAKERTDRQEAWAAWFKSTSETIGPIRQSMILLTRLVWSLIVFIGVVGLVVIGFYVWGKVT